MHPTTRFSCLIAFLLISLTLQAAQPVHMQVGEPGAEPALAWRLDAAIQKGPVVPMPSPMPMPPPCRLSDCGPIHPEVTFSNATWDGSRVTLPAKAELTLRVSTPDKARPELKLLQPTRDGGYTVVKLEEQAGPAGKGIKVMATLPVSKIFPDAKPGQKAYLIFSHPTYRTAELKSLIKDPKALPGSLETLMRSGQLAVLPLTLLPGK